jgi:hypothetical protein
VLGYRKGSSSRYMYRENAISLNILVCLRQDVVVKTCPAAYGPVAILKL